MLSYNFYNRYQFLLKNAYTQNASFFIKTEKPINDLKFFEISNNFKNLYDNPYNNFIVRLNNKKNS